MKTGVYRYENKEYERYYIEESDISKLKAFCYGFVRGEDLSRFATKLEKKILFSSNYARELGLPYKRDANVGGEGVYFRFLPYISKESSSVGVISKGMKSFTGVGAASDVIYFMPLEKSVGLSCTVADYADCKDYEKYKVRKGTSKEKKADSMLNGMVDICQNLKKGGTNASQIAFYKEVSFDRISDIFISKKTLKLYKYDGERLNAKFDERRTYAEGGKASSLVQWNKLESLGYRQNCVNKKPELVTIRNKSYFHYVKVVSTKSSQPALSSQTSMPSYFENK